jgi:Chalcone isomerase-like
MGALSTLTSVLLIFAAINAFALPQAVQQQINNAQPLGRGRLTFMFVSVYDISLYGQAQGFNPEAPYALKIDYLMPLKGEVIVERTIAEIKKQPFNDAEKLTQWQHAIGSFFPDVDKGISLTGFKDGNGHTQFYHNETWIGQVRDQQFTERFFAIWLGSNTSHVKLRQQLLGAP